MLRVDDNRLHNARGTHRRTFSITPESRLDLAASSPEITITLLVHQLAADAYGLASPHSGYPHVPGMGRFVVSRSCCPRA